MQYLYIGVDLVLLAIWLRVEVRAYFFVMLQVAIGGITMNLDCLILHFLFHGVRREVFNDPVGGDICLQLIRCFLWLSSLRKTFLEYGNLHGGDKGDSVVNLP